VRCRREFGIAGPGEWSAVYCAVGGKSGGQDGDNGVSSYFPPDSGAAIIELFYGQYYTEKGNKFSVFFSALKGKI
jgi:hypothetical protein